MQVKESTFLITGAASGLGAATAERLVAAGARVVLCDLNDSVNAHAQQLGASARAILAWFTARVWLAWLSWLIAKAARLT